MSSSVDGASLQGEPSLASTSQSSNTDASTALVSTSSGAAASAPAIANNSDTPASSSSSSSLDEQIERLKRCEYLKENEVKNLCLRAREILVDEGNVQRVDAPVTVSYTILLYVIILLIYETYACCCVV